MPLRYVDPTEEYGRWYRALERFGRSRAGGFMARHLFWHIDRWLYRASGGRYPSILGGLSSAPLVSTGAKSGQPREHQLAYFHDGPDAILVASYLSKRGFDRVICRIGEPHELRVWLSWSCGVDRSKDLAARSLATAGLLIGIRDVIAAVGLCRDVVAGDRNK